jgi:glycerol-3-phosphate dehydrogenase
MTHAERISSVLINDISSHGGVIREGSLVRAVRQDGSGFIVTTSEGEFLARRVINTLGPWLDSIDAPDALKGMRPLWCKGFNILTRKQLHATHAIGVEGGGRLFFCVPRGEGTAIGTWYVPVPALGEIAKPSVSEQELEQFLTAFNVALPEFQISVDDIVAVDVGVLPMRREGARGPQLYGSEIISSTHNYAEVMSTKYTTFRSQGERAISALR